MEKRNLLIHGGDWVGYYRQYGTQPLDFSANLSPFGLPERIKHAVIEAISIADRYPDPLCRELSLSIAEKEAIPVEYCLCGNGAADLIFRIVFAAKPKHALVPAPCFAEYEQALGTVGCHVRRYILKEELDFCLDEAFLDEITEDLDMVFLCEPNNPTGLTAGRGLLLRILQKCREMGVLLILDECFNDFLEEPELHTLKPELSAFPNLLILKAFTKMYAMAGIRLGYCLSSNVELLETMRQSGQPWAVSTLAQAAGIAAVKEEDYANRVRKEIAAERKWLKEKLLELHFRVVNGEANYLLFQSRVNLIQPLREKGILLRSCENYHGLDGTWYRTAVRTHVENEKLILALQEVLRECVQKQL